MIEVLKNSWEFKESSDDLMAASREGYQNLQWFWAEFAGLLESVGVDKDALKKITDINEIKKYFRQQYPTKSAFAVVPVYIDLFELSESFHYEANIFKDFINDSNILRFESMEDHRKRSPLIQVMEFWVSDDFERLKKIDINFKNTNNIRKTSIGLDSDEGTVESITQITRDEILFPRPNQRRTKREPRQMFIYNNDENGSSYRFNYEISPYNYKFGTPIKSEWASSRNSFLPYKQFSLPDAMRRACSFQSVVAKD